MKSNRGPWIAALGLALTLALLLTLPHAHALAQPAPDPPDQVGLPIVPEDEAPAPDDLARRGDEGPDGGAMEAPQDGPQGGWMGWPPDGPGGGGMGYRRGAGHGMGRGRSMGEAMRALDLTADQKKRMADIRDRQQRSAIKGQADLRIAQLDLRKLMRADTPDRRAIDSQIEKMGSMRTAMQKSRVATMFEMRAVLTQEQRDKLKDWRENGGSRAEKRGGSDTD
jgi:Spy/CpxP family protein refolding chaperone